MFILKPQDFINSVKDAAIAANKQCGIKASLTIAQAILESGWGKSGLALNYHNLFGIKASSSWTGKSVNLSTHEFRNGAYEDCKSYFRVYDSWVDSIVDHTKVLLQDRYAPVRAAKDYKEACKQIQACGYATSPTYTEKLIKLIEQYSLEQYDVQAPASQPKPITPDIYTVQPGDTLSEIASKFNIAGGFQTLAKLNGIANPNIIHPGDKIKLHGSATPQAPAHHTTYVVKKGDSLWKISRDFHTTVDALARANNITNPSLIYAGQKIIIK